MLLEIYNTKVETETLKMRMARTDKSRQMTVG